MCIGNLLHNVGNLSLGPTEMSAVASTVGLFDGPGG